jgi:predicted nuclease of predicted toxin-antitoxin system
VRFLADENFPRASVELLVAAGHDVASVRRRIPAVGDDEAAERASSQERVLLTFDGDFGEMIFRRGLDRPPSVIYFRLHPQTPFAPATLTLGIIERYEVIGMFTVAEEGCVRQRPLPNR